MKLRRIATIFLLGLLWAPMLSAERVLGDAASVRIATYNLRNYLIMDRYFDGQWRPEYPKPEREKSALRGVIGEISPDILVLQEIGGNGFLEELRTDLAREGTRYAFSVLMEGPDTDRHVAVLSNIEPEAIKQHSDLDFKYFEGRERVKRGLLELSFSLPDGHSFKLFAVHLKSRFTDRKDDEQSELRRTREAEACRNRIIERTLESGLDAFLIAGDFNDHPNSPTQRRFLRRGDLEIGTLVPATDSRGELWTYHYAKEARYELVDGFVASASMLARIENRQGHIADLPGALGGSDHRMVFLDISGKPVD